MDGLWWKTLLKWMIRGYHYFWKHPYMVHYERTSKKNRCFFFMEKIMTRKDPKNQALAAQPTFGAQIGSTLQITPFDLQIKDLHPQKTNMDIPKMMVWKRWLQKNIWLFLVSILKFLGRIIISYNLGHSSSQGLCSKGKRSISVFHSMLHSCNSVESLEKLGQFSGFIQLDHSLSWSHCWGSVERRQLWHIGETKWFNSLVGLSVCLTTKTVYLFRMVIWVCQNQP